MIGDSLYVKQTEFDSQSLPEIEDEVVQFGNVSDKTRQAAIYLQADESGVPCIDVLDGIKSKSFAGCLKTRLGCLDGISDPTFTEEISGYGLYSDNVHLTGAIKSVTGNWSLNADGSGQFANGKISFTKEGDMEMNDLYIRGKIQEEYKTYENGVDNLFVMDATNPNIIINASDGDFSTMLILSRSTNNLKFGKAYKFKIYNMTKFIGNISLIAGGFDVYSNNAGDIDNIIQCQTVELHGHTYLELLFIPDSLSDDAGADDLVYNGKWCVLNYSAFDLIDGGTFGNRKLISKPMK